MRLSDYNCPSMKDMNLDQLYFSHGDTKEFETFTLRVVNSRAWQLNEILMFLVCFTRNANQNLLILHQTAQTNDE